MNERAIAERVKKAVQDALHGVPGIKAVRVDHDLNDPNHFTVILRPTKGGKA